MGGGRLAAWLFACAQLASSEDRLDKFIQDYLGEPAKYVSAAVDLQGRGVRDSVLVYLNSRNWCGSGGCTLLVLARAERSYRVVSRVTIVKLPIRVLETSSHGWRDIGVQVGGGGTTESYEAVLPFDGTRYPGNPSVAPARKAAIGTAGGVAIGR